MRFVRCKIVTVNFGAIQQDLLEIDGPIRLSEEKHLRTEFSEGRLNPAVREWDIGYLDEGEKPLLTGFK